ncbi:ABC transporter ATP-binding protein [Kiloniella litopenaei]|uniref:ABC transporter ATP-binding protein n=1 Tax=Kiloniella litopenaei TaxID=1549748 RepID=A0A0M2R9X6_9PROT|nr:ABC transporter ATP-binding protein [Kiloniella litopenaei]KKJ76408.1 ABC transporter ATP-binding protein [Kiloniella litopenaei]
MINVQDLRITFGKGTPNENKALQGVNLSVAEGEFVTVIGSNGAGKSTFMNCLTGELIADSGTITIDGKDVSRWKAARRSSLVSRVFQDPLAGTCEALTIEENLSLAHSRGQKRGFGLAINNNKRDLFRERLSRLRLGLEDRLADKMGLLSGGQRQAVSLIMATLQPTKCLLLDEHTAALDPRMQAFVLELTNDIVKETGITTLMITHSMGQALQFGTRTVMLHEGQVVLDVSGEERSSMTIHDLVEMFGKVRGEELDSDSLLLG